MIVDWPQLPQIPPELFCAVPETTSYFIDNDALAGISNAARYPDMLPVVSSVVLAERLIARPGTRNWVETTFQFLRSNKVRVVPFGPEDAAMYREVRRRIGLDTLPCAPDEELRASPQGRNKLALRRLRFDLLVFAASVRHRRLLVTNNTNDFQHFPFPQAWCTWDEFALRKMDY